MNTDGRVVIWFSCGAASACAAKLGVEKYPDAVVVYCNTLVNEHPDNIRFLRDVEAWTGKSVMLISSPKYKSVDDVIQIKKYMSGPSGAPCTLELKKKPRFSFQLPGDLNIFGLTVEERRRIKTFEGNNTDLDLEWILRDAGLTHADCIGMLKDAGIAPPVMYGLGFNNNNCLGCVKAGGVAYWSLVRKHFPDVFRKRCEQGRAIGARTLMLHDVHVFLDQLPPDKGALPDDTEKIECGVFCVGEANANNRST